MAVDDKQGVGERSVGDGEWRLCGPDVGRGGPVVAPVSSAGGRRTTNGLSPAVARCEAADTGGYGDCALADEERGLGSSTVWRDRGRTDDRSTYQLHIMIQQSTREPNRKVVPHGS